MTDWKSSTRVYRWHLLVRLLTLVFSLGLLALAVSLIAKPLHGGMPGVAEWVGVGVMGFVVLGALWINAERYVLTEQGVEQHVFCWRTIVRWDDIQELASGRDEIGLSGFSVLTKPKRPSQGEKLDIQLQVFNLIHNSAELKSLIIQRAQFAKVGSEGAGELYRRVR